MMSNRPEPMSPTFWQLQTAGWVGMYALMVVFAYTYIPHISVLSDLTTRFGIWFFTSWALRPICRSLLRRSLRWFQLELWIVIWASLAAIPAAFLIQLVLIHFRQWDWAEFTRDLVRCFCLLFFWCNLYFSIKHWQRSIQEREHLARVEADAREARLSALRYQLNPHFLFNALNAVATLARIGQVPAATRMLAQIADLLRTSLDGTLPMEVPLSEEMVFTERYLAIEQTRFEERLQIDLAIATETLEAAVPSMLLQPLVENAIRHGIAPMVEGGRIAISSEIDGLQLRIVVSNTGYPQRPRPSKTSGGIGLTNTIERLQTLYGSDQRLDLQWPETGGCEVLIEIPFHRIARRAGEAPCAH